MGFFEDLGKKVGSATDSATDKAKKMAETSKLKSKILAEEKKTEKWYYEIGKMIFELAKDDANSPVKELCDNITQSLDEIKKLQTEIDILKRAK